MRKLVVNAGIVNFYDEGGEVKSICNKSQCKHLLGGKVEMKKLEHGVRFKDGSGVPLMPEMRFNKDGSNDFSHLNQDDSGKKDLVENVRKFLVNKYGQSEGITRLRTMSAEHFFKINEDLNREKFDNSKGDVGLAMPEMKWNRDGTPDFSHLNT